MRTDIDLAFADGEYRFALGLAQIHELQTKCKVGIGGLYARVLQGRLTEDPTGGGHPQFAAYFVDDLTETVRQGLIGGGEGIVDGQPVKVSALRANELVQNYLIPMPLQEQWDLAAAILFAKISGYTPPDDEVVPAGETDKKKADVTTDGLTTPGL